MRAEIRIDIFLKHLGETWKKDGVDLRFTQFLFNRGIINTDNLYYIEEYELLAKFFPEISPREYLTWGTRGKDNKQELKYKLIKDLSNDHLKNIIETQDHLSKGFKELLEQELEYRIKENINIKD
jgi:hypothetical protein